MKLLKLMTAALFMMALAAQANEEYNCVQRTDYSPVDPIVGEYSVKVKILEDITKEVSYAENYDVVYKVLVDLKRVVKGKTTVRIFEAVATSFDVEFKVWANGSNGFGMYLYLDELSEAGITLTENGKKTNISVNCN